jgi:CRP/FNR family cyclic AMP-dependent transcriptional regulator
VRQLRTINIPAFDGFRKDELQAVEALLVAETYAKGAAIFEEGDVGRFMVFITAGKVEITKADQDDGEKLLATIRRGAILGEMSLFDKSPRSATARAAEKVDVLLLTETAFLKLGTRSPRVALKLVTGFMRTISLRLRMTSANLTDQL